MAYAIVDDLINERHWKFVFGTCVIEIVKVRVDTDSALFLLMGIGLEAHDV